MKYWDEELLKMLKKSSPFEIASDFGMKMTICESRLKSVQELK
jgi:hypothetical protein